MWSLTILEGTMKELTSIIESKTAKFGVGREKSASSL